MNTGIKGMGSTFKRILQLVGEMGVANVTGQSTNEAILGFELRIERSGQSAGG